MPGPSPAPSATIVALRRVFDLVTRIYFREVEIAGEVPDAGTGGRLFAANHVNGLVDPILVITQTPCTISPIAKSTLFEMPVLKWLLRAARAVPIVRRRDVPGKSAEDNDAVFAQIGAHLGGGGNVLIFPEGTSHNEPRLLALRTGAGRMLARSVTGGGEDVTFQAVALEFDDRATFRSRALVLFGPVRRAADVRADASDDAAHARAITEVIDADLRSLLFESESWEERRLVGRVASLYANDGSGSLEEHRQVARRAAKARAVLQASGAEALEGIAGEVDGYFAALDDDGFTDDEVARFARGDATAEDTLAKARAFDAAANVLLLPLAALGMALYALPYQLPRLVTRKLRAEDDVASTYKLGVGLVAFPAWLALLVVLAFVALDGALAWAFAAAAVVTPFAALRWLDVLDRVPSRARWLAPPEERRERLEALAARRRTSMDALESARARAEDASLAPAA